MPLTAEEITAKLDELQRQYEREIDQVFVKLNSEIDKLQVEPTEGPQEIPSSGSRLGPAPSKDPMEREPIEEPAEEEAPKEKFKVPKHWKAPSWRDTWRYRGLKGLASRIWRGSDPEEDVTWRYVNPSESNRRRPTLQEYAALRTVVDEIVDEYFVLEEGVSEDLAAIIQNAKDEIKRIVVKYVGLAHQIGKGLSMRVSKPSSKSAAIGEIPKPSEKEPRVEPEKEDDAPTDWSVLTGGGTFTGKKPPIEEPEETPEETPEEPEKTPKEAPKKAPELKDIVRKKKFGDVESIARKKELVQDVLDKDVWDEAIEFGFKPWTWFAWPHKQGEWEDRVAGRSTNDFDGLLDLAVAARLGIIGKGRPFDSSDKKSAIRAQLNKITGRKYTETQNIFSKLAKGLRTKEGRSFSPEEVMVYLDNEIENRNLLRYYSKPEPERPEPEVAPEPETKPAPEKPTIDVDRSDFFGGLGID